MLAFGDVHGRETAGRDAAAAKLIKRRRAFARVLRPAGLSGPLSLQRWSNGGELR